VDRVYSLLRHLTLPVIALTTSAGGRRNGMISNSAQRASLVTSIARISVYISKTNFTHELVHASGVFGIHLLRTDQWDLIRHLGLQSGRDIDKLATVATRKGTTGCPMLANVIAAFECRVVNVMDTGASTFFLGDIVDVMEGSAGVLMTSDYFRTHIPDDMRIVYETRLQEAQRELEELSLKIVPAWRGPAVEP
jgi:flavin reductase (DIM6/NTAB) family NADH-FMN oxidoreductase RutF